MVVEYNAEMTERIWQFSDVDDDKLISVIYNYSYFLRCIIFPLNDRFQIYRQYNIWSLYFLTILAANVFL